MIEHGTPRRTGYRAALRTAGLTADERPMTVEDTAGNEDAGGDGARAADGHGDTADNDNDDDNASNGDEDCDGDGDRQRRTLTAKDADGKGTPTPRPRPNPEEGAKPRQRSTPRTRPGRATDRLSVRLRCDFVARDSVAPSATDDSVGGQ